jgi:hypothetical protein
LCGCSRESTVSGKVTIEGVPPPERVIQFDSASAALQVTNLVATRHFVMAPDGGLANVLVQIKGTTNRATPATSPVPLAIHRALYEPYVIAVRTNQPVHLRNLDPILHSAHITPPPGSSNREKHISMPARGPGPMPLEPWRNRLRRLIGFGKPAPLPVGAIELRFPAPDTFVRLKCDVHPWEFGYIAVLDHPIFAITKSDGSFTLPPLPPGRYTIEARHLRAGTAVQEVNVQPGKKQQIILRLTAPAP